MTDFNFFHNRTTVLLVVLIKLQTGVRNKRTNWDFNNEILKKYINQISCTTFCINIAILDIKNN